MHTPAPTTLTTDTGHFLEAWTVTGTPYTRPGQQGEALAIAEAKRLNRKEREDEQSNQRSGAGGAGGNDGADDGVRDAVHAVAEGIQVAPAVAEEPAKEVQAEPQAEVEAPDETQIALAAKYRERIKFHCAAGVNTTLAVARAAREVPGYVGPAVKKRSKVI